jgi:hypothetical protein
LNKNNKNDKNDRNDKNNKNNKKKTWHTFTPAVYELPLIDAKFILSTTNTKYNHMFQDNYFTIFRLKLRH